MSMIYFSGKRNGRWAVMLSQIVECWKRGESTILVGYNYCAISNSVSIIGGR